MAKRKDPNLTAGEEKAVISWATKTRLEVLVCRQFGHSWTRGLTDIYKVGADLIRELGCGRCGMVRRDVTPLGEYGTIRRSYVAPPDYRREVTEGSARVPRWAIADSLVDRSRTKEPTQDILDWYYKRAMSE